MNQLNRRRFIFGFCAAIGLYKTIPLVIAKQQNVSNSKLEPDVIVVGSGAAGLSAAITAAENGANVIVLEKMPTIGGNSLISSGVINAPDQERQSKQGIEDSTDWFYEQTFNSGHKKGNPKLVRILVDNSVQTLKWLESMGVKFKSGVFQVYGGLWPRGHYPSISHGRGYISALASRCQKLNIPIITNSEVVELLKEGKRVVGVRTKSKESLTDYKVKNAVIIATGGFTANLKKCSELDSRLKGMMYTGAASATGEMLDVAKAAGAKLVDMPEIQCNLGPEEGFSHRTGYHLDVTRHILVNKEGKRFVAEDGARDYLRDAVLAQPGRVVFSIVDKRGFQNLGSLFQRAGVLGELEGENYRANTLENLAEKMKISPKELVKTVEEYNRAVDLKKDPLGREEWMLKEKIEKPPFYGSRVRMAIHYTMGGIAINENSEVLSDSGETIPGLYAAGEVTGGIHGSNRVGGNGLLDAFVFGRIAGKNAAK